MTGNTSTFEKIGPLPVRKPDFGFKKKNTRPISENDAFLDSLLSALSVFLPAGERFFINAVKRTKDQFEDPTIQEEIQYFINQEAQHSKQHLAFNRYLEACGFPALESEAQIDRILERVAKLFPSREDQLIITVAIEHCTAVLSNMYLQDTDLQKALDPDVRDLYLWHSQEEIEHKAVAYDIYKALGENYFKRIAFMSATLLSFAALLIQFQNRFYNAKPTQSRLKRWQQTAKFCLHPRMLLMARGFANFYSPSFHPWQEDDLHLIPKATVRA